MKRGILFAILAGGAWLVASSVLLLILKHAVEVQESMHAETVLSSHVIQWALFVLIAVAAVALYCFFRLKVNGVAFVRLMVLAMVMVSVSLGWLTYRVANTSFDGPFHIERPN